MKYIIGMAFALALAVGVLAYNEASSGDVSAGEIASDKGVSLGGIEVEPGKIGRAYNIPPGQENPYLVSMKESRISNRAKQVELLSDPNEDTRKYALQALRIQGTHSKPAYDEILRLLKFDESANIRMWACETLARVDPGSPRLMQALIEALADSSPWVIAQAAENLAAFGTIAKPALPRLLELVAEGDAWVSDKAAAALRIDPCAVLELSCTLRDELQCGNPDEKIRAAIALGAIGPIPMPTAPEDADLDSVSPEFERYYLNPFLISKVHNEYIEVDPISWTVIGESYSIFARGHAA